MIKYAIGTFVVFVLASAWLGAVWLQGQQTKSWTPTQASVLANDLERTGFGTTESVSGFLTEVRYRFEGQDYEAVLDEYLVGNDATVFVNPFDPTQVVGSTGMSFRQSFYPLVITITSGLFAIVLGLIALSPKED